MSHFPHGRSYPIGVDRQWDFCDKFPKSPKHVLGLDLRCEKSHNAHNGYRREDAALLPDVPAAQEPVHGLGCEHARDGDVRIPPGAHVEPYLNQWQEMWDAREGAAEATGQPWLPGSVRDQTPLLDPPKPRKPSHVNETRVDPDRPKSGKRNGAS
jgi:hypothetical protein